MAPACRFVSICGITRLHTIRAYYSEIFDYSVESVLEETVEEKSVFLLRSVPMITSKGRLAHRGYIQNKSNPSGLSLETKTPSTCFLHQRFSLHLSLHFKMAHPFLWLPGNMSTIKDLCPWSVRWARLPPVFFFISLICRRGAQSYPFCISRLWSTCADYLIRILGCFEDHKSSLLAVYASSVREPGNSRFRMDRVVYFWNTIQTMEQARTLVSCLVGVTSHTPTSRYAFAKIMMEEYQRRILCSLHVFRKILYFCQIFIVRSYFIHRHRGLIVYATDNKI